MLRANLFPWELFLDFLLQASSPTTTYRTSSTNVYLSYFTKGNFGPWTRSLLGKSWNSADSLLLSFFFLLLPLKKLEEAASSTMLEAKRKGWRLSLSFSLSLPFWLHLPPSRNIFEGEREKNSPLFFFFTFQGKKSYVVHQNKMQAMARWSREPAPKRPFLLLTFFIKKGQRRIV